MSIRQQQRIRYQSWLKMYKETESACFSNYLRYSEQVQKCNSEGATQADYDRLTVIRNEWEAATRKLDSVSYHKEGRPNA